MLPTDLVWSQPMQQSKEQFGGSLDFTYKGTCSENTKEQVSADVQDGDRVPRGGILRRAA